MRKIFIILLLIAVNIYSQKIYVYGYILSHDTITVNSFKASYPDFQGSYGWGTKSISQAVNEGYSVYIYSYVGAKRLIDSVQSNYDSILVCGAAGSNSNIQVYNSNSQLPVVVMTGGGDANNETGYDIEFFDNDPTGHEPDLSSYSNAYIAGKIAKIKYTLNCSWWEARYRARVTASRNGVWSNENGYGVIDVTAAINYYGNIPSNPYTFIISPPEPDPDPINPIDPQTEPSDSTYTTPVNYVNPVIRIKKLMYKKEVK